MDVVKWINNRDVELEIATHGVVAKLAAEGIRCLKSPQDKRRDSGSVFVRYIRSDEFSPDAYTFNDNRELFELCMKLRELEFAFWGIFKTERSPFDYMQHLQRTGQLSDSFIGIQAGEATTQEIAPGQAWSWSD